MKGKKEQILEEEDVTPITIKECDDDAIVTQECENDSETLKKLADMTYQAQRVQAEFDNYRRRTAASTKTAKEEGRAEVIERLLPVLDSFDQAFKFIKDESILAGVRLIFERLFGELAAMGLSKIGTTDEFDPRFHNAVMAREEGESGKILEVLQDGYMLGDKVLRASSVIVSA